MAAGQQKSWRNLSPQPRPAFIFTTKHFLISYKSAIFKFLMPDAITAL